MDIVGTVGEHWGRGIAHCDSGTVAHAGQEDGDEDSDGHTEPIQLPVLGLNVQSQLCTERKKSVFLPTR